MTIKETVKAIMEEIKPTVDMEDVDDIIDGGYLDSLEFMSMISALNDQFGIEIDVDDIIPENFNSLAAIEALVSKLKQ